MTIKRHITKAIIAGVAILSLSACGSVNDGGSSASGEKKDASDVKIGFLQKQQDAPYFSAMVEMAKDQAKAGGFEVLVQDAAGDPVTQLNQAQTMLSQGVDAIVVNAISPNTQKAQLDQIAQEIPVIFVDTGIPEVGVTAVTSDNSQIGKLSGELTAERFIGEGKKSISVAILNGGPNDEIVGPQRQQGFLDGLEEGGVTYDIVGSAPAFWAQDKAVPAAESLLAANPTVDLILGLNDSMALGALTVLKDQGNTTTLVAASSDGQKEALRIMKEDGCSGQYVSTGLNSPSLASERAFEIALQLATGEKVASDFKPEEFTKAAGIDCNNVADFYDADSIF